MVNADSAVSSAHQSAINILLQYAFSLDDADGLQLQSSFTDDAILDLTKFSSLGMDIPAIQGRDAIVDLCMNSVGKTLDTSHTLTNFRVTLNEGQDEAKVVCYAEAQHFKKGQGLVAGVREYCLVKSKYDALVVRTSGEWMIKQLDVEPMWSQGTASVFGA